LIGSLYSKSDLRPNSYNIRMVPDSGLRDGVIGSVVHNDLAAIWTSLARAKIAVKKYRREKQLKVAALQPDTRTGQSQLRLGTLVLRKGMQCYYLSNVHKPNCPPREFLKKRVYDTCLRSLIQTSPFGEVAMAVLLIVSFPRGTRRISSLIILPNTAQQGIVEDFLFEVSSAI
jgi:hypothetical protein